MIKLIITTSISSIKLTELIIPSTKRSKRTVKIEDLKEVIPKKILMLNLKFLQLKPLAVLQDAFKTTVETI